MLKTFSLPAFMDANTDFLLINEVEYYIKKLKIQKCAAEFLNIFNDYPSIEIFSFNVFFSAKVKFYNNTSLSTQEEVEDLVSQYLFSYKNIEAYEDFFISLSETELTRENIEEHVAIAMGQKDYDNWTQTKSAYQEKQHLEKKVNSTKSKQTTKQKV